MDGVPLTDVVMPELYHLTPRYVKPWPVPPEVRHSSFLTPFLLPAIEDVRRKQKLIYEAHDVEAVLKRSILPGNALGRQYLALTENIERRACESCDLILACLEDDAETFHQIYGTPIDNISVIPNGVDLESVTFRKLQTRRRLKKKLGLDDRFTVLFMGSWHGPNIEASFCLMEIARRLPHVKFLVVGSVANF